MTSVPVARAAAEMRTAGRALSTLLGWVLFGVAWLAAKTCRAVLTAAGGVLFAVGFLGGRVVWPAVLWAVAAVRLGWDEGRKPVGGRRGSA